MNQEYIPPLFVDGDRLAKVEPLFSKIDSVYRDFAEANHFPGYAYGILLDGQLVHFGSGGFIDLDKKIPATSKSIFRVASITKSFTAMAILKLRDEGLVNLDDPIHRYIPEMNGKITSDAPAVTIRDLLTHSAGFSTDDPWGDRKLDESDEELIALLKKGITYSNSPGVVFEYSNLGYAILGFVIKKITGLSCGEYIRTAIWDSLGMDASWEFAKVPEAKLAHGYRWEEVWKEEELLHDGAFGPMGGMMASVESFSRYVAYHQLAWPPRNEVESGPIKRSSIREMHRPWNFVGLTADSMVSGYGYGLLWQRDSLGRVYVGHNGGLPGFGSNWYMMPEYGLGVILFANVTYAPAFKVNLKVLDQLIVEAGLKPRQLPPSKILKERQNELLKSIPHWEVKTDVFAKNFFLDRSLDWLKEESTRLFSKVGKIALVGDLIAENQLRGYFIVTGERGDLRIDFGLTPENPSLIQYYQIKEVVK